jgi:glutamate-1-semialdehyde aminotransferase/acyl carrier protein
MSTTASLAAPVDAAAPTRESPRRGRLIADLCRVFEDVSGIDVGEEDPSTTFLDLGLDSLSLTQVALQLQKTFSIKLTFRQLIETYSSVERLAEHMDKTMPADSVSVSSPATTSPSAPAAVARPEQPPSGPAVQTVAPVPAFEAQPMATGVPLAGPGAAAMASRPAGAFAGSVLHSVVDQQLAIMAQQLALLGGSGAIRPRVAPVAPPVPSVAPSATAPSSAAAPVAPPPVVNGTSSGPAPVPSAGGDEEIPAGMVKYDVKKAFGAIARIHTSRSDTVSPAQKTALDAFIKRYTTRTKKSKDYTTTHRPHLADPRVVNGFRLLTKEIVYQIVVDRSKGAHVWDLDGNEYVDVLSGFGMSMFGWQPQFVVDAVKKQIDAGYEIGPQHALAGDVARLICDLTGFDRAAFCNTGSEAVMGNMRIARTLTGRSTIAIFSGSYHGIFDEVIVRGTKKLRAVPAAPGILPSTAQNVLVLDYGTPESLEIIKARADELAAVMVEPVQSRRPDFQPKEFLAELRQVTERSGAVYIWDEVVTGFRAHPGGTQAHFGIKADLASYGKVIGGGFPIGIIAGRKQFVDALDGGFWQFGDDSTPTVGVTYFAGTFVRHPLALAACKAVLEHLKSEGPALQENLNSRTAGMANELNAFFEQVGAPLRIKHFASLWRTAFTEDHLLQDLLFAMLRLRGIHILDNFPCFMTTAHTPADIALIVKSFKEAVTEMQQAGFFPPAKTPAAVQYDASRPPVPGARLGRDPDGRPAWYVPNPAEPGKYMRLT